MEAASNGYNVGHARIALAIVGRREVIAKIGKVTHDALVEVGELLFSEGVAVESRRIGTSFK